MRRALFVLALFVSSPLHAQQLDQLDGRNVDLSSVAYRGRTAVRVDARRDAANATSFAVLKGVTMRDGAIDVYVAGKPAEGAGSGARGFIGVAFRLQGDRYEYIYLRPTNGRADDQVRRNHSTQYGAHPDFDFARLRKESPEKYESYVDHRHRDIDQGAAFLGRAKHCRGLESQSAAARGVEQQGVRVGHDGVDLSHGWFSSYVESCAQSASPPRPHRGGTPHNRELDIMPVVTRHIH